MRKIVIDREKAIEYLEWIRPKNPYTLDRKNVQAAIDMSIEALKEQRPHGEWIEKHCDYGVYYRCSNCHKMPPNYECDYKEGAIKTNFCPNCGADMRKEGEKLENDRRGIPGIPEADEKAE